MDFLFQRRRDPQDRAAAHQRARDLARAGELYAAYDVLEGAGLVDEGEPYAREIAAILVQREAPILERLEPKRDKDFEAARGPDQAAAIGTRPAWGLAFKEPLDPDEAASLGALKGLRVLTINGGGRILDGEAIEALAELEGLSALMLADLVLTEQSAALKNLRSLEYLALAATPIPESAFQEAVSPGRLKGLWLRGEPRTAPIFEALGGLFELGILDLEATGASDDDLSSLRGLAKLRTLSLADNDLTGEGFAVVEALPALRSLDFSDNEGLYSEDLTPLRGLPGLRALALGRSLIDNLHHEHLPACAELRALDLSNSLVYPHHLEQYAEDLPKLWALDLSNTQLDERAIPHLLAMSGLRLLDIEGSEVSAEGLVQIGQHPSLKELVLPRPGLLSPYRQRIPERVTLHDSVPQGYVFATAARLGLGG